MIRAILMVLVMALPAAASEPGYKAKAWGEPAPRVHLQLNGGPGELNTLGGQLLLNGGQWGRHSILAGVGLDWLMGGGDEQSAHAEAHCIPSRPDHEYASSRDRQPPPPTIECHAEAWASESSDDGRTLFQVLTEYRYRSGWALDPYASFGIGVADRELAGSVGAGVISHVRGRWSVTAGWRWIGIRGDDDAHGGVLGLRYSY